MIDNIVMVCERLMESAGSSRNELLVVGVGSPGPLDPMSGVVICTPNMPGWQNVPLAGELRRRLNCPCFIDNDGNAATFGEYWRGAGRGMSSMVALTLGTGIGGGIILNGRLWYGASGFAGEVGHIIVEVGGRDCNCGSRGCWEQYASATGIVRTAFELLERYPDSSLRPVSERGELSSRIVYEHMKKGDPCAQQTWQTTIEYLAAGITSLVNLLALELIVISGGVVKAGMDLFQPLHETLNSYGFRRSLEVCQIKPAELGARAGAIGAAGLALARNEVALPE